MIFVTPNHSKKVLIEAIYSENLKIDRVDAILSNLLALRSKDGTCFEIPFDDVISTIELATYILRS